MTSLRPINGVQFLSILRMRLSETGDVSLAGSFKIQNHADGDVGVLRVKDLSLHIVQSRDRKKCLPFGPPLR
jgi:hypothetical protein